ncbi:MAG: Mrp/NBP35 family ATP-binding protein [Anaerolineae bacterium]
MVTPEQVRTALSRVEDPELGRDIVHLGMVRDVQVRQGAVSFTIALTTASCPLRGQLTQRAREEVSALDGVRDVDISITQMSEAERQRLFAGLRQERPRPTNRVARVVAVMSGKGGVGKSFVAAMLAIAWQRQGKCVGILDADITGPSIPRMFFPTNPRPQATEEGMLPALTKSGIAVMSINLLLPRDDEAVIWRGPLISGAIRQFWEEVIWGELDYLVVDLPPGTSDASLTVVQSIPLNGVVLVTSPQALSGMVVRKAASMVSKLNVPLAGVVENMAYAVCPRDGERLEVFGPSHAAELAASLGTDLLGSLPLSPQVATLADAGDIEAYAGDEFAAIATRVASRLAEVPTEPIARR